MGNDPPLPIAARPRRAASEHDADRAAGRGRGRHPGPAASAIPATSAPHNLAASGMARPIRRAWADIQDIEDELREVEEAMEVSSARLGFSQRPAFVPYNARPTQPPLAPARATYSAVAAGILLTTSGAFESESTLFMREPFSLTAHLVITGQHNASSREGTYCLLYVAYVPPNELATPSHLSMLRRLLLMDLCNCMDFELAYFNKQEDLQICTKQKGSEANVQWVTTWHVVVTFRTAAAATRACTHQLDMNHKQLMNHTKTHPCIVHIAGKPPLEKSLRSLHQVWAVCPQFASMTDTTVLYSLQQTLHKLWASCRTAIPKDVVDQAEASLLYETVYAEEGESVSLEPMDLLYVLEFYKLHKPVRNSPIATVPTIMREHMAERQLSMQLDLVLPGNSISSTTLRILATSPATTLRTNALPEADLARYTRNAVVFQYAYARDDFSGLQLPPLANIAPVVDSALNYKLDRNATRVAQIFRRTYPDIVWSIPTTPPSHQVGLPIELIINSHFGVAGFRPSGTDYGGTNSVRRVTLSLSLPRSL